MSQPLNWKEMLAALQQDVAQDEKQRQAESARGAAWGQRLHDVFNSKSAQRASRPFGTKARKEFDLAATQGLSLVNEILGKVLKNELGVIELSHIHAQARDITPVNPLMFGMLLPVASAAHEAFTLAEGAYNSRLDARYKDVDRKELAVFRRYLAQNPEAAPVLKAMMPANGANLGVGAIEKSAGRPVSRQQLQALVDEISPIFGNIHNIGIFSVMQLVKPEFQALPGKDLREEHFNSYYHMGGSAEARAAVQECCAAQEKRMQVAPKTGVPGL